MKVLFSTIYSLFVASIVLIALLLLSTIVPIPGNFRAKIVKSGSMEPSIRTGGVVFIHSASSYEVGDIVTFGKDTKTQIPTTHRIVEISGDGPLRAFTTKGDANDAPDPQVQRISDIGGKVIFSVPYLGYILDFAKKPFGFTLIVGIPALVVIFDEVGKIISEIKSINRKKILNAKNENKQKDNFS